MTTTLTPPVHQAHFDTGLKKGVRSRTHDWFRRHTRDMLWLAPILLLAFAVQAANMSGFPQRTDDEGTYMAQAWAVLRWGELAHYTYWYDHPPLGWFQLAAYAGLTGSFERWGTAVMAGRESMIVAFLITGVLIWALARRLRLSRPASVAAVAVFAFSPLAVIFHRTVYLDNVAAPWLLAAFLLATSPRRQLMGFAGAAACFGVTVLTKETFLLALPFLAWTMWRNADRGTRRYTLSVAACILTLFGISYVLLAAIKGEVFPEASRVSLVQGIEFQLVSRGSGDSLSTFMMWWQHDPIILPASAAAGIAALFFPRLRPLASMLTFLFLIMLRPGGYLPIPYVIIIFPFAAVLLAALGEKAVRGIRRGGMGRRIIPALAIVGSLCVVGYAVPLWGASLTYAAQDDTDKATVDAQQWVIANVPRTYRLIVDDTTWVDFVRAGFSRENVLWFYKLDTDPSVQSRSPNGWKDADYVISTVTMRGAAPVLPEVQGALTNSEVVAAFGDGGMRVEVRRIYPSGIDRRLQQRQASQHATESLGKSLVADTRLQASAAVRDSLTAGDVDPRIVLAVKQKLATATLSINALPAVYGEDGVPPRQLLVSALDGEDALPGTPAAVAVRDWADGLRAPFQVSRVQETPEGVVVSFPFATPEYLLPK